jgi:hypothetical protein
VIEKLKGKEGELTAETAKVVEKEETEKAKLEEEEMKFAGGVKPAQEEKKEDEEEGTAEGDKLEAESIDEAKSEARKRKPEEKKPEHGTKPTGEKIPPKIEKQGTEAQLLGERELSEIEKQNLVEVEVVVGEEDEEEEGTVFIYLFIYLFCYLNPLPDNVENTVSKNNSSRWQMGFNSAFKGLK